MSNLPDGWKEKILNEYRQGHGVTHAHRAIGFSKTQHYWMLKQNEEYALVHEEGKELLEIWWVEEGMKNMNNRNWNTPLFNRLTSVLLKWGDDKGKKPTGNKEDEESEEEKAKSYESKYKTSPRKGINKSTEDICQTKQ